MKKNVDYVVVVEKNASSQEKSDKEQVVLVDRDTGELMEGSRLFSRLHQFLEMKENLFANSESQTIAGITHPKFFQQYGKIYGLTGTIGTKQDRLEIQKKFNVLTFDIPTYLPGKRIVNSPIICATHQKFHNSIGAEVKTAGNRPVLILADTIAATKEIGEVLEQAGHQPAYLDGIDPDQDEKVVDSAGQTGAITIATNIGGRGMDIKLSSESRKSGGLHVILSFFPSNTRVEQQALGRAARQGDPGSSRKILSPKDPAVKKLDENPTMAALENHRSEKNRELSFLRQKDEVFSNIQQRYQQYFFDGLKNWRESLTDSVIGKINQNLSRNKRGKDIRGDIRGLARELEATIKSKWAKFFTVYCFFTPAHTSQSPLHSQKDFNRIKSELDGYFNNPAQALQKTSSAAV